MTERAIERSNTAERPNSRQSPPLEFDPIATLTGMIVAMGGLVIVGSLVIARHGSIEFPLGALVGNFRGIDAISAMLLIVAVMASFFAGGWVSGRVADSDHAIDGTGAALLLLVLFAIFAVPVA